MNEHDRGYQISIIIDPQVEDGYYGNFFFQYRPLFVGIYHRSGGRDSKHKALAEIQKITGLNLNIRDYIENLLFKDAVMAFSRILADVGTVANEKGPLHNHLNPSVIYTDDNSPILFQNHVHNPNDNPNPVKKKAAGPKANSKPKIIDVSGVWL